MREKKYVLGDYQNLAIDSYDKCPSYQKIADFIYRGDISKSSVFNLINSFKTKYTNKEIINCNGKVLFLNINGIFVKRNASKKAIHIKTVETFTGRSSSKDNGRSVLLNRKITFFIENNTNNLSSLVENFIYEKYENFSEIKVIGDGARWIKNLARYIDANFYIDIFHIHKSIRDLNRSKYMYMLSILNSNLEPDMVKKILTRIVGDRETGVITNKQIKLIGYIVNNTKSYRKTKWLNLFSCIEGIQAHYIAKYIKKGRKGFIKSSLINILNYRLAKLNDWEEEPSNYNEDDCFEINYSYKEHTNLPILRTSSNTCLTPQN